MKKAILIIFSMLVLVGCSVNYDKGYEAAKNYYTKTLWQTKETHTVDSFDGMPWCRHKAVFNAMIYGEFYPIRMAIGPGQDIDGNTIPRAWHIMAEAYIDGEWRPLKYDKEKNRVVISKYDWFFRPTQRMSLQEYLARFLDKYEVTSMVPVSVKVKLDFSTGNTKFNTGGEIK